MTDNLTNQEKLEEVYQVTMENHEILVGLRRQQNISNVFKILYWAVILGILGGAYYFIKPTIDAFSQNKEKFDTVIEQLNSLKAQLPEGKLLNEVLDTLKK